MFGSFLDPAFVALISGVEGSASDLLDDMESYTNAADLGGLNGGTGWNAAYVSRAFDSPLDDMESYANAADLNGLNGGSNWDGPYVSR